MQDGPLFLKAMRQVNELLRSIKNPIISTPFSHPSTMMAAVESWTGNPLPEKVLMRIIDESYQRAVGPNICSLRRYEAFSSTVYGELMPTLIHEIIQTTGLNQDSLFLDLGSGVANVVAQASLQSGCTSYGIELLPHPAQVAKDFVEQIEIRCRMWGVRIGKMELDEGDMLESGRVDELISKADVVLVDNKVFDESCELLTNLHF
jgi:H3 lysine-79-specific histone-lysine N-methyltransferase